MIYRRVPYAQEAPVEIVDLPSARRVLERLFANADNQLNAHYASHPENAPSWWSPDPAAAAPPDAFAGMLSSPVLCATPPRWQPASAGAPLRPVNRGGDESPQRSSLESLAELEKLLEEQHRQLIEKGFIPKEQPWSLASAAAR